MAIIEGNPIELTPELIAYQEAWEAGAYQREVDEITQLRRNAYQLEADPLNFKWQETGLDIDRVAWLEKKDEIKARYPDPVKGK